MKIGLIPNTSKADILDVVTTLIQKFRAAEIDYILSDSLNQLKKRFNKTIISSVFLEHKELSENCDILISIGGDGTMLNTAYEARESDVPMLGLNFGKLGFLAEFDMNSMDKFIEDIRTGNYEIEERMALEGKTNHNDKTELFAINDIVIDKGGWPKMIQMTVKVDDEYVTTFSADGIIIATPTGSTGYSLSTGGPIVNPKSDVITLSPISPHSLTMRPLVLSSKQKISIEVESHHTSVQVNCDGQRVYNYDPPVAVEICKKEKGVKLVHTDSTNYFEILRNKLFWGMDLRNKSHHNGD